MSLGLPRLGVNIDHVATLRQLRGTPYPSLLDAARAVEAGGGLQITIHLREDRRHIQDADVRWLRGELVVPLNLEMAASDEMVRIAKKVQPAWACLVPEKRNEVTTEGGLDLKKGGKKLASRVRELKKAGIRVSLFVEPTVEAVRLSAELGADAVELHTGRYCIATQGGVWTKGGPRQLPAGIARGELPAAARKELDRIAKSGDLARSLGIHCHAGHGLDYQNVRPMAALRDSAGRPLVEEYNIGHSIVCRAAIGGMERAVREMVSAILAP